MSNKPLTHLLIPKDFRLYCRPDKTIGPRTQFTRYPSRCTCANCLTALRQGREFRVAWTGREA